MFFAILVFSNRFSKCTGLRRGYLITKTWLVPFISFPFASLPMADASSIVYRTQPAPVARDWYYHLRRAIPTVRILSRPETPDDDTRSTFRTCAKGRLLRCLTFIHAAIVSLLGLSFSHSLANSDSLFLYRKHTPIGTPTSCPTLSWPAFFVPLHPWSFAWTPR